MIFSFLSHRPGVSDDILVMKAVCAGEEYCVDISARYYKVLSVPEESCDGRMNVIACSTVSLPKKGPPKNHIGLMI